MNNIYTLNIIQKRVFTKDHNFKVHLREKNNEKKVQFKDPELNYREKNS